MDSQNYQEESDNNKEVQYTKDDKVKASLSIINKCSVINYKKAVEALTSILYEDDEALNEFLQKIDQPADIIKEKTGEFLACEYNRDGDSYRSNIDNAYYPISEDSKDLRYPSNELREMELTFNKLFREYTKLYFGGGALCSCYIWNLEESIEKGICIAVIIKNIVDSDKGVKSGCWDSSHLIVVNFNNENNELQAKYKLTSTVFFSADLNRQNLDLEFSGSVTKLIEENKRISKYLDVQVHLDTIGTMIEDVEGELRSKIETTNLNKTKEILDTSRFSSILGKPNVEGAQKLKGVFMNSSNHS